MIFLKLIVKKSEEFKLPLCFCGEDAGKPLEALILCALGFKTLSMQPNSIAPVKSVLRNINLIKIKQFIDNILETNIQSLREPVIQYLEEKMPYNQFNYILKD